MIGRLYLSDTPFCSGVYGFVGSSPIARPGHLPDIARCPGYGQCPEYGQFSLSIFRTSTFDVRDMASKNWPYPGHCPYPGHRAMSGRWPGRAMGLDPQLVTWSSYWLSTSEMFYAVAVLIHNNSLHPLEEPLIYHICCCSDAKHLPC